MTVALVSLGCAKNAVDLQVMAGHLVKAGHRLVSEADGPDVILVNTCAFIESAREEAAAEILRACELKARGACRAVVAAGCFVQRYRKDVLAAFPGLDAIVGIDALDAIVAVLERKLRAKVPAGMPKRVFDAPVPALRFTGEAFAYLKIAEGCAHRCAYCAIPGIRGNYRSRPLDAVVAEARELLATGVKELNIIAQDPMLYGVDFKPRGTDLKGRGTDLVTLLRALDRLDGDFWVRVLYSYPSEITDGFLEWMNTSPHAVKYIDVPVQHTDPGVLRAMARGAAVEATLRAAERLRAAVPGVTLRTTVLTGFPGETPAAYRRLLRDVRTMRFDHLGAFAFSPEEGTPAAEMPGRPTKATAERRARDVMRAQEEIWAEKAKTFVGRTFRALVVEPHTARLESQAPDVDGVVRLTRARTPGTFIRLKIKAVDGFDFVG